jgi:hypothetical protein
MTKVCATKSVDSARNPLFGPRKHNTPSLSMQKQMEAAKDARMLCAVQPGFPRASFLGRRGLVRRGA